MTTFIKVAGLVVREGTVETKPITFEMEEGGHALLGRTEDGPPAILRALAGDLVGRGSVLVHGQPPADVRRRIALVARDAHLPDALRVEEMLSVAATIRGDTAKKPSEILAPLGIEALATRRISTLRSAERRAVALAEAIASSVVDVLLVEEPFAELEAPAAARVLEALKKKKGCIVVATASTRDASLIAKDYLVLERGRPVHVATFEEAEKRVHGGVVRYRLLVDDARKWLASAAVESSLGRMAIDGDSVVIEGSDAAEIARAIGRAIVASGVDVRLLARDVPPLDELRASIAGQYAGVYQAAVAHAKSAAPPPGPPAAGPPPVVQAVAQNLPTPTPRLGGDG